VLVGGVFTIMSAREEMPRLHKTYQEPIVFNVRLWPVPRGSPEDLAAQEDGQASPVFLWAEF
jgi:hypothetical protein